MKQRLRDAWQHAVSHWNFASGTTRFISLCYIVCSLLALTIYKSAFCLALCAMFLIEVHYLHHEINNATKSDKKYRNKDLL
ncbi:MAG: hypothetical protein LBG17_04755 [Bacteroidales bacterium]|jgi:hypothetical protein|nr:hypothetical protein [Bacteroidales bacterium]